MSENPFLVGQRSPLSASDPEGKTEELREPDPETPADLGEAPSDEPAEVLYSSLDPKVVKVQRVVGWITLGVIGSVLLFILVPVLLFAPLLAWAKALLVLGWLAGAGGFGLLVHRWPALDYRHASYRLDDLGIEIRRGVYWRRAIRVPRSRVQHLDVAQGPLERGLGLGTLVIFTAGTDHARVELGGLAQATAFELRDSLLPGRRPGDLDDAV